MLVPAAPGVYLTDTELTLTIANFGSSGGCMLGVVVRIRVAPSVALSSRADRYAAGGGEG